MDDNAAGAAAAAAAGAFSSHPVALAFAVAALQNVANAPSAFPATATAPTPELIAAKPNCTEDLQPSIKPVVSQTVTSSTQQEQQQSSECHGSGSQDNWNMPLDAVTTTSLPAAVAATSRVTDNVLAAAAVNKDESEEDAAKRLARSRERNREHARRTRLRKKAQLEALQSKVRGLEAERQVLKQSIEECSIASILLGLSGSKAVSQQDHQSTLRLLDSTAADQDKNHRTSRAVSLLASGKRKRFVADMMKTDGSENSDCSEQHAATATSTTQSQLQPLKLNVDGQTTIIGGGYNAAGTTKSHINWKTGVYVDENGAQKQLTQEQLENLRRERNRMHAKMTRDRKKCFIATIEKTIGDLEKDCQRMRELLSKVSSLTSSGTSALSSSSSNGSTTTSDSAENKKESSSSGETRSNIDMNENNTVVTPTSSPELTGQTGPPKKRYCSRAAAAAAATEFGEEAQQESHAKKRVPHGFSLLSG